MSAHQLRLTAEEQMAHSRAVAGIEIVDDEIAEPLAVLVRELNGRSGLDAEGARAFERRLARLLVNRLRMRRDLIAHPEIAEQPIHGPVVVMGTARSGTTKLQKVLAASGDVNFLAFWQSFNWASVSGEPNEPIEERVAEADAFCRWFDERSPEAKLGHRFEALEPEEDGPLGEGSFVSTNFIGFAEVPGYARWLGGQSRTAEFEFLRSAMQYLQWQGLAEPGRPWVMKSPDYCGRELDVLEVFPDARFVMAHRSPLETLPSMCKLVGHFRTAHGAAPPDPRLLMEHAASSVEAQRAVRTAHPELPLLDLLFEDITGDLGGVVDEIYAHVGMTLSDTARSNMLRWDEEHAMHQLGRFTYSLEEIGLDEVVVRQRMASAFELIDLVATRERTT